MKKKIFFGSFALVLSGIVGFILYAMTQLTIQALISCSANTGGIRIPSSVCEYYMLNYRLTEEDIASLREGAGLGYILNGQDPEKHRIAEIFISHGLDINGINHYGNQDLTPLHGSALMGDIKTLQFLLRHGADIHIKSNQYETALELAKKFHKANDKLRDRTEIIRLLSDAEAQHVRE
ncbi:MAG: ankyrin repeat domain-containing protein [Gammaproteobacteria bacterium]|nr:ankyrin repeat domain-containing protein [Gammaproteobacteria bacterium]